MSVQKDGRKTFNKSKCVDVIVFLFCQSTGNLQKYLNVLQIYGVSCSGKFLYIHTNHVATSCDVPGYFGLSLDILAFVWIYWPRSGYFGFCLDILAFVWIFWLLFGYFSLGLVQYFALGLDILACDWIFAASVWIFWPRSVWIFWPGFRYFGVTLDI